MCLVAVGIKGVMVTSYVYVLQQFHSNIDWRSDDVESHSFTCYSGSNTRSCYWSTSSL